MNLRSNVNKIHFELSNKYENVSIDEKSDHRIGNFVEFSVVENNRTLKFRITKYELEKDSFDWIYFSNPEDESSIVERKSNISTIINDVDDIFEKNRFDSDYLKKLN